MAFSSCQTNYIRCFGWDHVDKSAWCQLVETAKSFGWNKIDKSKFISLFAKDVDLSYNCLFEAKFTDLDTDIKYRVFFDNKKGMFNLELLDAEDKYVYPDQKIEYFHSDEFKKLNGACYKHIMLAYKNCKEFLDEKVKASEMLEVNEIHLEAIEDMLRTQRIVDNLENGRFYKG